MFILNSHSSLSIPGRLLPSIFNCSGLLQLVIDFYLKCNISSFVILYQWQFISAVHHLYFVMVHDMDILDVNCNALSPSACCHPYPSKLNICSLSLVNVYTYPTVAALCLWNLTVPSRTNCCALLSLSQSVNFVSNVCKIIDSLFHDALFLDVRSLFRSHSDYRFSVFLRQTYISFHILFRCVSASL